MAVISSLEELDEAGMADRIVLYKEGLEIYSPTREWQESVIFMLKEGGRSQALKTYKGKECCKRNKQQ